MSEYYSKLGNDFVCGCLGECPASKIPIRCSECAGSLRQVPYCHACNGQGFVMSPCDNPQHYPQPSPTQGYEQSSYYQQQQYQQQYGQPTHQQLQQQQQYDHYQQGQSQPGSSKSSKKSSGGSSGTHKHRGSQHGHGHRRDRDQGAGPATPRR